MREDHLIAQRNYGAFGGSAWFEGTRKVVLAQLVKEVDEVFWDVYAGLVSLLDHCVGQIVERLKDEGMYDDAVILWTSDHGEMLGSHCLWQKMCMYEESTHVPLAVKLPSGARQVCSLNSPVSHIDVLPTLCDLLSVPVPDGVAGLSLRDSIERGASVDRDRVFMQFDGNGARGNFQRAVVCGPHKLIVDFFKDEVYFELYDVVADPQERRNLAFAREGEVRDLSESLIEWMGETGDLVSLSAEAYDCFLEQYAGFQLAEPHYPLESDAGQVSHL